MTPRQNNQETFEYKAEMKQLLHLIVHSLYTHPEIFLRELISNASDALHKVRFQLISGKKIADHDADLCIRVTVDPKTRTFCIEDTGIGMGREELIDNLGMVARSGTVEFMKTMAEQHAVTGEKLIGQFGVGFYSCFMVADEVVVRTRRADPDAKGYEWRSQGAGTYSISETSRTARGTEISFTLKEGAAEFAEPERVRAIIRKYSQFVDFPLSVNGEKFGTTGALWHRKPADMPADELNEFYRFVAGDHEDPLGHLPIAIEGTVNFKALVFIPAHAPHDLFRLHEEHSLHLYSNKVMIQTDCKDLLPEYLRFVRGVVDTTDLPLNVSREIAQTSPVLGKIRGMLVREILSFLKKWAGQDPDRYQTFYRQFGRMLAAGITMDFENRDTLIELLRFSSSLTSDGQMTSLKDYVVRMQKDQKDIYYLSGETSAAAAGHPKLEYFKKNSIEVLLLSDPTDVFIMPAIGEYEKHPVRSVDAGDLDLVHADRIEKPGESLSAALTETFKRLLGDRVADVTISKRLVDSPAILVTPHDGMDPQMERIMRSMHREYQPAKRILEVNPGHPLFRNLSRRYLADPGDPLIEQCIMHLYDGALLLEGALSDPIGFVRRMTALMEEATK